MSESRIITVKGTGRIAAMPDTAVLSIYLESKERDYRAAWEMSEEHGALLAERLEAAGFSKSRLKTTDFNVRAEYENVSENGVYRQEFAGYVVSHEFALRMAFEPEILAKAMDAISGCAANPRISVSFTMANPERCRDDVLRAAAKEARRQALVLCEAADVELGELISIEYGRDDRDLLSPTRFAPGAAPVPMQAKSMELHPEAIELKVAATFVWSIR